LNCPLFNTARMVSEYATRAYFPASDRYYAMTAEGCQPAKELAAWKTHLFERWYDIKILDIDISESDDVKVNQSINVKALLNLAGLTDSDVEVQLYKGPMDADGNIINGISVVMDYQGTDTTQQSIYTANIAYSSSGLQGLSLRVLPKHPYLSSPFQPGLQVLWANS
jgi:glycogen phosphorylase